MEPTQYHIAFTSVVEQSHNPSVAVLSPNGAYLASCGYDGTLSLLEAATGRVAGTVSFEERDRITSMIWASESVLFIGKVCGDIQAGTLVFDRNMGTDIVLDLSTVVQRTSGAILSLAYDTDTGLLAYADSNNALLVLEESPLKEWQLVDQRVITQHGASSCPGKINDLQFFGSVTSAQIKPLIIGMDCSMNIWTGERDLLKEFKVQNFSVAKIALSMDGALMAVSTQDLRIAIWPLLSSGPDLSDQSVYNLPVSPDNLAPDNFPFAAGAPMAFVQDNNLLVANPFSGVVLLSERAEELCRFNFPSHYVKSITSYGSWVYMTSVDPHNVTRVDGYTHDEETFRQFCTDSDWISPAYNTAPYRQKWVNQPTTNPTPTPNIQRQLNLVVCGMCLVLVMTSVVLAITIRSQHEVTTCYKVKTVQGYISAVSEFYRHALKQLYGPGIEILEQLGD